MPHQPKAADLLQLLKGEFFAFLPLNNSLCTFFFAHAQLWLFSFAHTRFAYDLICCCVAAITTTIDCPACTQSNCQTVGVVVEAIEVDVEPKIDMHWAAQDKPRAALRQAAQRQMHTQTHKKYKCMYVWAHTRLGSVAASSWGSYIWKPPTIFRNHDK